MMYMIQISPKKVSTLSEYAEKILSAAGKMMSCLEALESEGGEELGERSYSRMGNRYEPEDMDERYGDRYGYRRGVKGTGPYSRY